MGMGFSGKSKRGNYTDIGRFRKFCAARPDAFASFPSIVIPEYLEPVGDYIPDRNDPPPQEHRSGLPQKKPSTPPNRI